MSAAQLRKVARKQHIRIKPVKWMTDEDESPRHGYVLMSGKSRILRAEYDTGPVWFIEVYDPSLKTRAGIHTNLTLRDALKAYGPGDVDASDEGPPWLSFPKLPTLNFGLADLKGLGPKGHMTLHSVPKVTPKIIIIAVR